MSNSERKQRVTDFLLGEDEFAPILAGNVTGLKRGLDAFDRLLLTAVFPESFRILYSSEYHDPWEDEDTIIQVLEEARNVWKPLSPVHSEVPEEDTDPDMVPP